MGINQLKNILSKYHKRLYLRFFLLQTLQIITFKYWHDPKNINDKYYSFYFSDPLQRAKMLKVLHILRSTLWITTLKKFLFPFKGLRIKFKDQSFAGPYVKHIM